MRGEGGEGRGEGTISREMRAPENGCVNCTSQSIRCCLAEEKNELYFLSLSSLMRQRD